MDLGSENGGGAGKPAQKLMNGTAAAAAAAMAPAAQQQDRHEPAPADLMSGLEGEGENVRLVQGAYGSMASGENFNRLVKGIRILSARAPTLLAQLEVAPEHANDKGAMHGGCTASLVDILTATSVRLLVPDSPIVSIDLSVSYLAPARLGEAVLLEAVCLKAGRSVAFTEATFRRRGDGQILVKARQQLAILASPQQVPRPVPTPNGLPIDGPRKAEREAELLYEVGGGSHLEEMRRIFADLSTRHNYYKMAKNIEVLYAQPPILAVRVALAGEHLNNAGTMHGGFTASMVDIVTSRAVSMQDGCPRSSMDLSVSYLLPAKLGDEIVVEAKCLKVGGMMAFTEATLTRSRDGAMVAKGKHNMLFLRHYDKQKQSAVGEGPRKTAQK